MDPDAQAAETVRELKAAAENVLLDAHNLLGDEPTSAALARAQAGLASALGLIKMYREASKRGDMDPATTASLLNQVGQTAHTMLDGTLALAERHYTKAVKEGAVELIDDLDAVRYARSQLGVLGKPLQVFAFVPDAIGLVQAIQRGQGTEVVRKGSSLFSGWVALRAGARGGLVIGLAITTWVELHLHLLRQLGAMLAAIKEREKRKRTADLHQHLLVLASHAGTLVEMYWAEWNGKKRVSQEALTKQAQKVSDHLGAVARKTWRLEYGSHKDPTLGELGVLDLARRDPVFNSKTVRRVMQRATWVIVRRLRELRAIGAAEASRMYSHLRRVSSEVTDYTPPPLTCGSRVAGDERRFSALGNGALREERRHRGRAGAPAHWPLT